MYQDVYSEKCSLELGDEVAEPFQHIEADAVVVRHAAFRRQRLQARIEILVRAVGEPLLVFQEEGDVVDAGRHIVDIGDVFAEAFGEMSSGVLDAMAEADISQLPARGP